MCRGNSFSIVPLPYDGSSRLLEVSDRALGQKTKYEYDILGRIVGEKKISTANNITFIKQQNRLT